MQVPILDGAESRGWLQAQQRGLYTVFWAEVSGSELCRVRAVFEGGGVMLGVPIPEGGSLRICSSLPTTRLPKGRLLRGELVRSSNDWQHFPGGSLGDNLLPPGQRKGNCYRFSWTSGERLPCDSLMCFFTYREGCLELTLDQQGRPVRQ